MGADGALPAPGVYGVPEQWTHIRAAYERNGFVHQGRTEILDMASVDEILRPTVEPVAGMTWRRSVGVNGTRISAMLDAEVLGFIEVESREDPGRSTRNAGWADIGNLRISEPIAVVALACGSWRTQRSGYDWDGTIASRIMPGPSRRSIERSSKKWAFMS
jgi:hypothetical protein